MIFDTVMIIVAKSFTKLPKNDKIKRNGQRAMSVPNTLVICNVITAFCLCQHFFDPLFLAGHFFMEVFLCIFI